MVTVMCYLDFILIAFFGLFYASVIVIAVLAVGRIKRSHRLMKELRFLDFYDRDKRSYEYLDRLDLQFNYRCQLVKKILRTCPSQFGQWVGDGMDGAIPVPGESEKVDEKMVDEYLTLLEVYSLLEVSGAVVPSIFWDEFQSYFQEIAACRGLAYYINTQPALWGVRANLLRLRREE